MGKGKHNRGIQHKSEIEGGILKTITGGDGSCYHFKNETKKQRRQRIANQNKSPEECYGC